MTAFRCSVTATFLMLLWCAITAGNVQETKVSSAENLVSQVNEPCDINSHRPCLRLIRNGTSSTKDIPFSVLLESWWSDGIVIQWNNLGSLERSNHLKECEHRLVCIVTLNNSPHQSFTIKISSKLGAPPHERFVKLNAQNVGNGLFTLEFEPIPEESGDLTNRIRRDIARRDTNRLQTYFNSQEHTASNRRKKGVQSNGVEHDADETVPAPDVDKQLGHNDGDKVEGTNSADESSGKLVAVGEPSTVEYVRDNHHGHVLERDSDEQVNNQDKITDNVKAKIMTNTANGHDTDWHVKILDRDDTSEQDSTEYQERIEKKQRSHIVTAEDWYEAGVEVAPIPRAHKEHRHKVRKSPSKNHAITGAHAHKSLSNGVETDVAESMLDTTNDIASNEKTVAQIPENEINEGKQTVNLAKIEMSISPFGYTDKVLMNTTLEIPKNLPSAKRFEVKSMIDNIGKQLDRLSRSNTADQNASKIVSERMKSLDLEKLSPLELDIMSRLNTTELAALTKGNMPLNDLKDMIFETLDEQDAREKRSIPNYDNYLDYEEDSVDVEFPDQGSPEVSTRKHITVILSNTTEHQTINNNPQLAENTNMNILAIQNAQILFAEVEQLRKQFEKISTSLKQSNSGQTDHHQTNTEHSSRTNIGLPLVMQDVSRITHPHAITKEQREQIKFNEDLRQEEVYERLRHSVHEKHKHKPHSKRPKGKPRRTKQSDEHSDQESNEHLEQQSNEHLEQQSNEHLEQQSNEHLEQQSNEQLEQQSDEHSEENVRIIDEENVHLTGENSPNAENIFSAIEGDTLTLRCPNWTSQNHSDVHENSTIVWLAPNGDHLYEGDTLDGYSVRDGLLIVAHANSDDAGRFTCLIEGPAATSERKDVNIDVLTCANTICLNGGTCGESNASLDRPYKHVTCRCAIGWQGSHCRERDYWSIALMVAIILAVLGIVASFVVLCVMKCGKNDSPDAPKYAQSYIPLVPQQSYSYTDQIFADPDEIRRNQSRNKSFNLFTERTSRNLTPAIDSSYNKTLRYVEQLKNKNIPRKYLSGLYDELDDVTPDAIECKLGPEKHWKNESLPKINTGDQRPVQSKASSLSFVSSDESVLEISENEYVNVHDSWAEEKFKNSHAQSFNVEKTPTKPLTDASFNRGPMNFSPIKNWTATAHNQSPSSSRYPIVPMTSTPLKDQTATTTPKRTFDVNFTKKKLNPLELFGSDSSSG